MESLDQEETFAQQGALAWNLEKKQKLDKEQSFQENSERFQQKEKVGTIEVLKTYGILANINMFLAQNLWVDRYCYPCFARCHDHEINLIGKLVLNKFSCYCVSLKNRCKNAPSQRVNEITVLGRFSEGSAKVFGRTFGEPPENLRRTFGDK